jgi:hypothetical protein
MRDARVGDDDEDDDEEEGEEEDEEGRWMFSLWR